MRFFVLFGLILGLATSETLAERVGRIDTEHNGAKRCADEALPQERCNEMRERARSQNCVSQSEYELLAKYNLCPTCDWYYPGAKAYLGYCPPGCFARGTLISVRDLVNGGTRREAIEKVVANPKLFEVWSLEEGSTVSKQTFGSRAIRMVIAGPERKPMVNLMTSDGSSISVTSRHPMILDSGEMVAAEDLKVGDLLAKFDGTKAEITNIERSLTDDDVFNLLLDVDSPISHSIIAEGLVTGDQYWQGRSESFLGTTIFDQ